MTTRTAPSLREEIVVAEVRSFPPAGRRPRVVLLAYSEVGVRCLETLCALGSSVVAVFTYRDDPHEEIWFRSVADWARAAGLPVYFESLRSPEGQERLRGLAPDLILSAYYRDMIDPEVLSLAPGGAFNVHGSLLPRYRGRACINWAILRGETETGATLHEMVARPDAGDVLDQEGVSITFEDTALSVSLKVADAAARILIRTWPLVEAGTAPRFPQDATRASYFGRRGPEDGRMHWERPARELYNLVRAVTHPWPGAFFSLRGKKIFVWRAFPEEGEEISPGKVLSVAPLRVGTGRGVLRLDRVQEEGDEERDGGLWGAARLRTGERLEA